MRTSFYTLALASTIASTSLTMSGATLADNAGKSPNQVRYHGGDEIVLQGFHWNVVRDNRGAWYNTLANQAASIADDGFTAVWMPPPWRDHSAWSDPSTGTSGGGEGYFWHDFNKDGQYGSDAQLKQASRQLRADGVKVVYDIVPNHMNRGYPNKAINLPTGQGMWRHDCPDPASNVATGCDDGDRFMGGDADLNTGHPDVFGMFSAELRNLKNNYGAGGFRFDFVRGYSASRVDAWMGEAADNSFCVGELWKSPAEYEGSDWRRQASWQEILKDWSDDAKCTIFDFALKERMQNGSIADWRFGLNGNSDPRWREVAVTFVDNHDTGYSPGANGGQHHWALPDSKIRMAYAYILSSPGTPVVYWAHMYNWGYGDFIRQLIQVRKSVGVKASSEIRFHGQYSGLVGTVTGDAGKLVFALDSNLSNPEQIASGDFRSAVTADNGKVRVWKTGGGSDPRDPTASVNFRCDNGVTNWGQSVYVVGNTAELGNWNASAAVRLPDASGYPSWTGSIALPTGKAVEWKCIIRSESNPSQVIKWQSGANNRVTATAGATTRGQL
ncbi:glucan 1,4-alpha-maltotetraohydrolase domain-containing protein [Allohahella sp. A8]|uniref:glucan 1,4-alpha-maltotetraohydrolase domain-containing protein n=1 Tax=Allohahella sp. A8 TaxID=3141461 RepID=UPI003A7FF509